MRWSVDRQEVQGFGVNYTLPFAHAFRSAQRLGLNPQRAIDQDVAQFARLGFDLFRVHVWDTEISDTLGNLLSNEQLQAFDYLLKQLSDRGINYVLTPIAFWGNGWPEPDEATPGFSRKYGKDACLTHPEAIKAQERYLIQFMNHVNSYTGTACKDDPRLIAVEISNEPHHRGTPEEVTAYIRRLVDAIRRSGYANPVFYNVSHSVHLAESYFRAGIQGGTFQWYPTGLGYQQELPLNVLPQVDHYPIPFDSVMRRSQAARLVYEFDAADVGRSYAYPAMARAFRGAGMQLATHFSYDPTFLAHANTEYNTHYMNLAFTPGKALSLMISAEVFRRIPRYADFGRYPQNTSFGDFSVSYAEDLAMLNAEDLYYHTNHTDVPPVSEKKLRRIAGYGHSPIVRYEGTGAYFLDKISEGNWRLEVMPDALVTDNPYGRNSLQKAVAHIQWNERKMMVSLADLGADFRVEPLNEGNLARPRVAGSTFLVSPGVYLLTRKQPARLPDRIGALRLREFKAPPGTTDRIHLVHVSPEKAVAHVPLTLEAAVLSPAPEPRVSLQLRVADKMEWIEMEHQHGFHYKCVIPAEMMKSGILDYHIVVESGGKQMTFPAGKPGSPQDWDFTARQPYNVSVYEGEQPVLLFDARSNWSLLSHTRWLSRLKLVPLGPPFDAEYQIAVEQLARPDPENLLGQVPADFTIHHYLNPTLGRVRGSLSGKQLLVLQARSLTGGALPIQISLVGPDGIAYGAVVELGTDMKEYEIPLSSLRPVPLVLMPRPYPTFLPYYFQTRVESPFDLRKVEGLQISMGPGLGKAALEQPMGIAVSRIWVR